MVEFYVDHSYYKDVYGGSMEETDFNKQVILAQAALNYYTFNRVREQAITDEIKMAVCELSDLLQDDFLTEGKVISSEGVSTLKVAYKVTGSKGQSFNHRKKQILLKWLGHTGLLYRGNGTERPRGNWYDI